MTILHTALAIFLWPGNRFCAEIGSSPAEDSGMLRGFINSIVWGLVVVLVLWQVL